MTVESTRAVGHVAAGGGALLLAILVCACTTGAQGPSMPAWFPFARPRLRSFLGVRFGERLSSVRLRYAAGRVETSPYGAEAYRLSGVAADSVRYETVIYEFTEEGGMQLVMAKFSASSTEAVFRQLHRALGAANSVKPRGGASDPQAVLAWWQLGGGGQVRFSGRRRVVVMLGPEGAALTHDIELRTAAGDP